MNRIERVQRAIEFKNPDHVPFIYVNSDLEQSDIIGIGVVEDHIGPDHNQSEWGYEWERLDATMGQPKEPIIKEWDDLKNLHVPDPKNPARFSRIAKTKEQYGEDRYYLASMGLSGFTSMTLLRGFSNVLEDLYLEPENIELLADIVFGFEEQIISQLDQYGVHGVQFWDDWGSQDRLLISKDMWIDVFKPRYKHIFQLAHSKGLTVFFHCCGYIWDIIGELIDCGVDMLNISQPNLFDIQKLGELYSGKTCFVMPVSYQTTSLSGTRDDIFHDVQQLVSCLGNKGGGLIGYIEEYSSIGMSPENYRACIEAFETLGQYDK